MIANSITRVFNNRFTTICTGRLYYSSSVTSNTPTEIKLSEKGKRLEITFKENSNNNNSNVTDNNQFDKFSFSSELLRIETPSVEKSKKGLLMISGRRDVSIIRIERVGNYAIKLIFDDLHDTGIYSWEYLYQLGKTKYSRMKQYLKDLKKNGKSRDPKIHNKQLKQQQQQQQQQTIKDTK